MEHVRLTVDWGSLGSSGDPESALSQAGLQALRLQRGYDADEVRFVAESEEWKESCHVACADLHGLEERRLRRVAMNEGHPDREPKPVAERTMRVVVLRYPRPGTRGMWNREVE